MLMKQFSTMQITQILNSKKKRTTVIINLITIIVNMPNIKMQSSQPDDYV